MKNLLACWYAVYRPPVPLTETKTVQIDGFEKCANFSFKKIVRRLTLQ